VDSRQSTHLDENLGQPANTVSEAPGAGLRDAGPTTQACPGQSAGG